MRNYHFQIDDFPKTKVTVVLTKLRNHRSCYAIRKYSIRNITLNIKIAISNQAFYNRKAQSRTILNPEYNID